MNEEVYNEIAKDMLDLFLTVLKRFNLGDSNLYNDASEDVRNNIFSIYYNDYLEYIESGRRPKAKKVPIKDLIEWAKQKGIPTDNNTIYAIQQSIYNNGIPSRGVLEYFSRMLDERFYQIYADKVFEYIIQDLMK